MFGLCDCNNFFVSCERVFLPSLEGRPVVVLSSNDGCIIARSEQAKALGLKMGQPLFQAREIVDKNNVALFSGNMRLYGDMSQRVMMSLAALVPSIEIYSIDEAFINFDGMPAETLLERGQEISRIIKRNTGIPVSLGIASTKTLAKIASKLCKRYPKLKGCCVMYRKEDIEKVLRNYPIGDVWGIGGRYAKLLNGLGVVTAYDFTQCGEGLVRAKMGITGLRTWSELRGERCIDFESSRADKQSICVSRSFAKDIADEQILHSSLGSFVAQAAQKLRKQSSCAAQMQLFVCTNRHREDLPQQYESRLIHFETATDSTIEMSMAMSAALKVLFKKGYGYKRAGIILSDITPKSAVQSVLFDTTDRPKHTRLMQTIDSLNAHLGRDKVALASQGFAPVNTNREHLSPQYTTRWSDIITIKV